MKFLMMPLAVPRESGTCVALGRNTAACARLCSSMLWFADRWEVSKLGRGEQRLVHVITVEVLAALKPS